MEVKWLYFHYYHHISSGFSDVYERFSALLMTEKSDPFTREIFQAHYSSSSFDFVKFVRLISLMKRGDKSDMVKFCHSIVSREGRMRNLLKNSPNSEIRNKEKEILSYFFPKSKISEEEEDGEEEDEDEGVISYSLFLKLLEDQPVFEEYVLTLFSSLPGILSKLMKCYTNDPITKEGYLKIQSSKLGLGLFKSWERKYFICKGSILSMFESSECLVPVELFNLFGSKLYRQSDSYVLETSKQKQRVVFQFPDLSWLCSILHPLLEENGNKHGCFAPTRYCTNATWFVNGKMFYERVADVLENAKFEIFMSCWWLTPQIFLRRGPNATLNDRFDYIIKKKASEGVMIYFLIWNHPSFMSRLDCEYVAGYFTKMHPNCKILLHPHSKNSYGHHQKMMVIDQRFALEGGLDICCGRYDVYDHPLTDPCQLRQKWPGKDYWNPTVRSTDSVRKPFFDFVDRETEPRMGWHDVSVELDGDAARDLAKNFIERWNNSRAELIGSQWNLTEKLLIEKNIPYLLLRKKQEKVHYHPPWYDKKYGTQITRMKKVVKHCREEKEETGLPLGSPNDEGGAAQTHAHPKKLEGGAGKGKDKGTVRGRMNELKEPNESLTHTCKVQATRSLSDWSGKSRGVENSLYQSHIHAIRKAQHYIFIEQQYFFTDTASQGVQNAIGTELIKKVEWAIENNRNFRIYVCFPIYPDGSIRDDELCRIIMYYNAHSSVVGETSILSVLKKKYPNVEVDKYISFYCLKNWGELNGKFVIEQVYPHTKMMIVDDKIAIIGSANICDRSFLGDRDSEISCTIEDFKQVKTVMDGKPYWASHFAYSLRMFIFNEFLGHEKFDDHKIMDPVSDETYNLFLGTARNNSRIFEEVFPFSPSNKIKKWEDLGSKESENFVDPKFGGDKEKIRKKLNEVNGILIEYPEDFLAEVLWTPTFELVFIKKEIFQ